MNILLVSATLDEFKTDHPHLVTGIGMISTAIKVSQALLKQKYDLVINVGIAGSFKKEISLGSVVEVVKDCLSELGAEDGSNFLCADTMGFDVDIFIEMSARTHLKSVSGITVNTVHGNTQSISSIINRLNPDVESMEGAACMLACKSAGVPCVQIRSISNYIEERNKTNWNIPLAISNLEKEVNKFLNTL